MKGVVLGRALGCLDDVEDSLPEIIELNLSRVFSDFDVLGIF